MCKPKKEVQYQKGTHFKVVKANLNLVEQRMVYMSSNLWEFITVDYKAMGMILEQLKLIWEKSNPLELTH